MNREIKFRAWDRESIYYNQYNNETSRMIYGITFDNPKIYISFAYFDLMQYVGLKDKNGKEIYEGDIIGIVVDYQKNVAFAEVIFKDGAFIVKSKNLTFDEELLSNIYEKYEVVGNIFENPELLNDKETK